MRRGFLESACFLAAIAGLAVAVDRAAAQTPAKPPLQILDSDPLPAGAEMRLGTNRLRLGEGVGYFMFSPDDATVMIGAGGNVHFWETKAWKETWKTTSDAFSCSPDGKHVAKKTGERTIEIWDVQKKALVHKRDLTRFGRQLRIFDVEFNPKGDGLWVGLSRQGAWLYNWAKDEVVAKVDYQNILEMSLIQSRDRKILAVRHVNNHFAIIDGVTGKMLREIRVGINDPIGWQALNYNGTILANIERPMSIAFWDVATGKKLALLPKEALKELIPEEPPKDDNPPPNPNLPFGGFVEDNFVGGLRFVFDKRNSLFVASGKHLAVVDLDKKKVVAKIALGKSVLTGMAVSGDNRVLVLGYNDGVVEIRDPATLAPLIDDPHPRGGALQVVFARDGQSLATYHNSKSAVRVWNRPDGRVAKTFDVDDQVEGPENMSLAFLPDQRQLALGLRYRWNLSTGAVDREPVRADRAVGTMDRMVRASDDAGRWVTVKENPIGDATGFAVVDAASKRELLKLPFPVPADTNIPGHSVRAIMSADGGIVGLHAGLLKSSQAGDGGTIEDAIVVWNVREARPATIFSLTLENGSGRFELSPDGRFLVLVGRNDPGQPERLWHLPSGAAVWKEARQKAPNSPIGKDIVDFDGPVDYRWSSPYADVAAFSPDSQFLASSADNGVAIREALSGATLFKLTGQPGYVCHLAFSPDGRSLASATSNSTVILWKISPFGSSKPGVWKLEQADKMWNDLRGDAPVAYQAMAHFHAGGDEAVAFLKDKIRLSSEKEDRQIVQTVTDLAAAPFLVREKATIRLEKWGARVVPFLSEGLARPINLEQKRRLISIVERYKNVGLDADELRLGRTVYLLERIGTPGARVMLESMARGHAYDLTAQSARGALARPR